ncbi:hypothetical protein Ddye_014378 [Dipteronia dyeriana]|uniref:Retrotransposon gag domain-containing protein n=1 Tax=Dipteronia dyeriana TaxID=168575 RepID=A0AAE0CKI3_9ROSI|nr:hypothetical protein Ddye_014378 [Dipteronia dyeriana]
MGWIYKAEQYFDFKNIAADHQVQLASFHLYGITLQWHYWLTKFRGPQTWAEFSQFFLHRFRPTDYEDPVEAISRFKKQSTVTTYQEEFEKLSHRVDGYPKIFSLEVSSQVFEMMSGLTLKSSNPRLELKQLVWHD